MRAQREVLRKLAYEYREIANIECYKRNFEMHKAVNDMRMIRPVVLIDELPWHEMNMDGLLTPLCENEDYRAIEVFMRRTIYRHKYFPADMIVRPYIPVQKIIHDSGIGINVDERILRADEFNNIVAHEYHDQLSDEMSLNALHPPVIIYDREETLRRLQVVGDAIGDIIPVRLTGVEYFASTVWDSISTYRGVTNLLTDLFDRPEYTHKMVEMLTTFELERLRQYEEQELFDCDPYLLHCTCIATGDLPETAGGTPPTRKNVWGRGAAQIFASVSPAMHDEFDIQYMTRTIGTCGLSYYGCCEPLDKKMDVVSKLPNLRKVSVTPWADARVAAEAVAGRYVVAAKPNPASVAVAAVNRRNLRDEILYILRACRDNNCSCDIVLKDISTCLGKPGNIFEWEQTVMETVKNF